MCSDIPEWLQEIRENLEDDRVPEHRDSHASSSHEASLEPILKRREDLCEHSVYTHFPKDRNCEICQRTKITRAPCRRRIGGAVPRAENFGDLITADHKVLSESCESRNNHRYAVVVRDLAINGCNHVYAKLNLLRKHERVYEKILNRERWAESKKELLQCYCNPARMKSGRLIHGKSLCSAKRWRPLIGPETQWASNSLRIDN